MCESLIRCMLNILLRKWNTCTHGKRPAHDFIWDKTTHYVPDLNDGLVKTRRRNHMNKQSNHNFMRMHSVNHTSNIGLVITGTPLLIKTLVIMLTYYTYIGPLLAEIRAGITKYIHVFLWNVITHQCPNVISSWRYTSMSNHIALFYVDIITYLFIYLNAGVSNFCL